MPDQVVEVLDEEGVTLAGSGTVFHQMYLAAQQKSDGDLSASVRGRSPAAAHRSRRRCTTR